MNKGSDVKFDKDNKVITFKGDVIVDFRSVVTQAKAKLFSKMPGDTYSYEVGFSIRDGNPPFDFGFLSLNVAGFIAAAIENRLQIEGMHLREGIEDAYKYVWLSDLRPSRTKPFCI